MQTAAPGRRPRLARLFQRCGLPSVTEPLRTLVRGDVRILAYHRVLEADELLDFRFDLDLVSATAEAFDAQMRLLRRRFHPLRFDELCAHLDRGASLPRRAVLVTFDDGYEDNHRVAFPILRDLGMSAMFFVSTGHIDSGKPYGYDWFVHMLCEASPGRLELPELGLSLALPEPLSARRELARQLLDRLKSLDARQQEAVVQRLEAERGMHRSHGHASCRPMRWDDLRQMHRAGMEIGSHGVHHRMLAKLPDDEMRREVFDSKTAIERELGDDAYAISYPVGGTDAYDAGVIAATQEAGYRIACSYRAGAEPDLRGHRYELRRIPIERQMDMRWFEAMLAIPEAFGYPSHSRNG